MHTTDELTAGSFEYHRGEEPVVGAGVMPSITVGDRLGVVMAEPGDGLGAGNFVLACVTAFYDRFGDQNGDFFEYPDYYTFQASARAVDYLEFDIWPDHKNVTVASDSERVLRAINDRAVNVLLVPDGVGSEPEVEDVTRRSAERRIDACYQYAANGRLADAGFSIRVPRAAVEGWYRETAEAAGVEAGSYTPSGVEGAHVTQQFREIGLGEALRHLPSEG